MRGWVSTFRDPGLFECWATARGAHTTREIQARPRRGVRARARRRRHATTSSRGPRRGSSSGLLQQLETIARQGRADRLLRDGPRRSRRTRSAASRPTGATTASDLRRVARRYLRRRRAHHRARRARERRRRAGGRAVSAAAQPRSRAATAPGALRPRRRRARARSRRRTRVPLVSHRRRAALRVGASIPPGKDGPRAHRGAHAAPRLRGADRRADRRPHRRARRRDGGRHVAVDRRHPRAGHRAQPRRRSSSSWRASSATPTFPEDELERLKRETRRRDRRGARQRPRRGAEGAAAHALRGAPLRAQLRRARRRRVAGHRRATTSRAFYARHFVQGNVVVGIAGDVDGRRARPRSRAAPRRRPPARRAARRRPVPEPTMRPGRRLLVVDKPERTQTQILVGDARHVAARRRSRPARRRQRRLRRHVHLAPDERGPLQARLVVRRERAHGVDRQRQAWVMWTFPAADGRRAVPGADARAARRLGRQGASRRARSSSSSATSSARTPSRSTPRPSACTRRSTSSSSGCRPTTSLGVDRSRARRDGRVGRAPRSRTRIRPEDLLAVVVGTASQVLEPLRDAIAGPRGGQRRPVRRGVSAWPRGADRRFAALVVLAYLPVAALRDRPPRDVARRAALLARRARQRDAVGRRTQPRLRRAAAPLVPAALGPRRRLTHAARSRCRSSTSRSRSRSSGCSRAARRSAAPLRALFPFGYFLAYEYVALSRCYGLALLLRAAPLRTPSAALRRARGRTALLLAALALTTTVATVVAAAYTAALAGRRASAAAAPAMPRGAARVDPHRRARLAACLAAALCAWPPADSTVAHVAWPTRAARRHAPTRLIVALVPIPRVDFFFWNSNALLCVGAVPARRAAYVALRLGGVDRLRPVARARAAVLFGAGRAAARGALRARLRRRRAAPRVLLRALPDGRVDRGTALASARGGTLAARRARALADARVVLAAARRRDADRALLRREVRLLVGRARRRRAARARAWPTRCSSPRSTTPRPPCSGSSATRARPTARARGARSRS